MAITGPGGSGKSSVAAKLVEQIPHCVNIKVDHVKHFISHKDFNYENDAEGRKQWQLLGDNIGLLARNFEKNGYSVIIDGYLDDLAWNKLKKHVNLTHKILILPKIEAVIQRDSGRKVNKLGVDTIKRHYNYFSTAKFYNDFIKVDSTDMTIDQTVLKIISSIGKNWGEL